MSRKSEFLVKAEQCLALATVCSDWTSIEVLKQAAEAWRMLAELEDQLSGPLAPWPDLPTQLTSS